MPTSKSKIDKAGNAIAREKYKDDEEYITLEYIFDEYRKNHLTPLTQTTLEIQNWLSDYSRSYYIAQRLKRKPQIIRKLKRFSVRLTQLQDIGGCRIIVPQNSDVSDLHSFLIDRVNESKNIKLISESDYRIKGRDDSGYRALHLILERNKYKIELQIRSKIQHYWAENIERTSVVYGHHLKELEGDQSVIEYFKYLSNIFFEIEAGREPTRLQKLKIDHIREDAEFAISNSSKKKILESYVDDGIIKTLEEVQKSNKHSFTNWIIIFNWNTGSFVSWDIVERDPDAAITSYVNNERNFPQEDGYEVVLIGSSDVATVKETHSHYFGIETYDKILESLDQSMISLSKRLDIDVGSRQILICLSTKKHWGKNPISTATLKNHFCKGNMTFEWSIKKLMAMNLIQGGPTGPISLRLDKKAEIEKYI